MAINKLALIRYKTIDRCLQNRYRKWTLETLMEKVSEALEEYEGVSRGVSRRTIQADIQLMRSDKLGYNAPIVVREKKYYVYEEEGYSINNHRITGSDVDKLSEMVDVLRQLNGFAYFDDMNDIIARLEDSLRKTTNRGDSFIQLEGNGKVKGLHHIAPLYQAIRRKVPLLITYQSFKAAAPRQAVYYPYLLKEYRNRWFLIAKPQKGSELITLALDRLDSFMEMSTNDFVPYEGVDLERYYSDVIGVTKSVKDRAQKIILKVEKQHVPYIVTKPLHPSQQLLKEDETGAMFRIDVVPNFELEREILGFGECMQVLAPRILQQKIKRRLRKAAEAYGA